MSRQPFHRAGTVLAGRTEDSKSICLFFCPSPLCCSVNGRWDDGASDALSSEDRYGLMHQQLWVLLKMSAYAHMYSTYKIGYVSLLGELSATTRKDTCSCKVGLSCLEGATGLYCAIQHLLMNVLFTVHHFIMFYNIQSNYRIFFKSVYLSISSSKDDRDHPKSHCISLKAVHYLTYWAKCKLSDNLWKQNTGPAWGGLNIVNKWRFIL